MENEFEIELVAYECSILSQAGWRPVGRGLWYHRRSADLCTRARAIGLQQLWDRGVRTAASFDDEPPTSPESPTAKFRRLPGDDK